MNKVRKSSCMQKPHAHHNLPENPAVARRARGTAVIIYSEGSGACLRNINLPPRIMIAIIPPAVIRNSARLLAAGALVLTPLFASAFDLEGHRGGLLLRRAARMFATAMLGWHRSSHTPSISKAIAARGPGAEERPAAFAAALTVGVGTLELDTAIAGRVVHRQP